MIMSLEKIRRNKLVSKEEYESVKDLTYAFNFKTPGQAFGKFLDIIKEKQRIDKKMKYNKKESQYMLSKEILYIEIK